MEEKGASGIKLIPIIKTDTAKRLLKEILPDYEFEQETYPVPKRAAKRYIIRATLMSFILAGVLSWVFWPMGSVAWVLVPLAAVYGFSCYRAAGWNLHGWQLTIRYRRLSRHTAYMKKTRIQVLSFRQTPWQNNSGLAAIEATIKSGAGARQSILMDAAEADAEKIFLWYQSKSEQE
jgi:putative membrane protein